MRACKEWGEILFGCAPRGRKDRRLRRKYRVNLRVASTVISRSSQEGVVVNLLNPKTALFFLAFLPQFVNPARGAVAAQVLLLGGLFVLLSLISDTAYALLAGTFGDYMRGNPTFWRSQRYVTSGIFVALGLIAALA